MMKKMDEMEYECCDATIPKTVSLGHGLFGTFRAICSKCRYVNAYFECACELEHDCREWKEAN